MQWRVRSTAAKAERSGGLSSTARKAARSGASVWGRSDNQPEAKAAEQTGSNEVAITLRWSGGRAQLEVKAGQQASSAGVYGLKVTGTFDVDAWLGVGVLSLIGKPIFLYSRVVESLKAEATAEASMAAAAARPGGSLRSAPGRRRRLRQRWS